MHAKRIGPSTDTTYPSHITNYPVREKQTPIQYCRMRFFAYPLFHKFPDDVFFSTRSSAIAEGPRDVIVSTNPADTRRRHIPRLT